MAITKTLRKLKRELAGILGDGLVNVLIFGPYMGDYCIEEFDANNLVVIKEEITTKEENKILKLCLKFLVEHNAIFSAKITCPKGIFNLKSFVSQVKKIGVKA